MKFLRGVMGLVIGCLLAGRGLADDGLVHRTWVVNGVTREALVRVPPGASRGEAPLVFAFHGHGGSSAQAAKSFHLHDQWPDAIIVYPQGLPTSGVLVDQRGRLPGWQSGPGTDDDRDLRFFDAMLADLRQQYHVDDRRIYAMGHSNGGGFTYLLWAERGDVLAAVAPSAAVAPREAVSRLKPKPVLHVGSPEDPLVKFAWQERMIDHVLKLNGCGARRDGLGYQSYPSAKGDEVALFLHQHGHKFPDEAPALIVKFFQAHARS